MNRNLLAGAAAIALALGAGSANAQAKFDLKIGGDAFFQAGFVGQDRDVNRRSTDFNNRFRLNIVASAKADNGLEYGARLRMRNNTNDRVTEADRGYMFVNGSFGSVRLGVSNSYSDDIGAVFRPIDYSFLGFWDEPVNWASTGNGTGITTRLADLTLQDPSRGTKIFYASPRFSGLQLGGSFTPQPGSNFTDIDRTKNTAAGYQDVWELGLNYSETFSGVGVKGSIGYTGGKNELSTVKNLTALQVGASIDYAGFTLGGGYMNKGKSGQTKTATNKSDFEVWNVGAQYATGPVTVGVGYTRGKEEGSASIAGTDKQDYYSVGANYKVAPGLVVGAEYAYIKFEDETKLAANGDKANVVILRSWLSF
jgi:outer membrane protein OmpU